MTTIILVYHSGVVITSKIDSYEFVGMNKKAFLLNEFSTLTNIVCLVRERFSYTYTYDKVHILIQTHNIVRTNVVTSS
jgi:hypothetical protein